MKRINQLLTIGALLITGAASTFACPLVYAINFSGQFGIFDLATGSFMPLGKGLENTPDGLTGAAGGPFYTVDGATGHLLRIAPDGSVSDAGDTKTGPNIGPNGVSLLATRSDSTILALDFSNRLLKINPDGAVTVLGTVAGLPPQESEYAGNMTTGMAGEGNTLYFVIEIFEGDRQTGPTIFTIDIEKLTATSKALQDAHGVIGAGIVNGALYLFDGEGHIFKADAATGKTDSVARYDSGLTEDGPPVTGIFGVVGGVEPNTIHEMTSEEVKPELKRGERKYWPARHVPLPARMNETTTRNRR